MGRKTRIVALRKPVFIATEGVSDRALIRWTEALIPDRYHFDIHALSGGSPLKMVEDTVRKLGKSKGALKETRYANRYLVLDSDLWNNRDGQCIKARTLADKNGISLLFSHPNLEGLLLRLHQGHETINPPPGDTLKELRKLWPDYSKGKLTAQDLDARFSSDDFNRLGRLDRDISAFVATYK